MSALFNGNNGSITKSVRILAMAMAIAAFCMLDQTVFAQEGDDKKESSSEKATETNEPEVTEADAAKAAETQATTEDESMEGLLARFAKLDVSMSDVRKQFDAATEDSDLREFRNQYQDLVNESNKVIRKIRNAGEAKLEAGEKDQQLFETMIGVMMNEASFNRTKAAFSIGDKLIKNGITPNYFEQALESESLKPFSKEVVRELGVRCQESIADDLPRVKLTTSKGDIVLELFENEAPQTVGNFISLVKSGYYDGLTFHRVLDGFMAQGGCPQGTGTGDPGYKIFCECDKPNYRRHFVGVLSMAKANPKNTGGSQFFITYDRRTNLDGKHTVFGRVLEGMDVAQALTRIDPSKPNPAITPDTITKAEVLRDRGHEYKPTKVGG